MFYAILVVLCISLAFGDYVNNTVVRQFKDSQNRLIHELFTDYDKEVSAVFPLGTFQNNTFFNGSLPEPNSVIVLFSTFQLVSVVETSQRVDVLVDYIVEYKDYRLAWNESEYSLVPYLTVQRKKVWVPEFAPIDVFESTDTRNEDQQTVRIFPDGTAGVYISSTTSLLCGFDVTKFPFDTQTCYLDIQSRSIDVTDYVIKSELMAEDVVKKSIARAGNGEWDVVNISAEIFTSRDFKTGRDLHSASLCFVLERRPMFYILMFMLPSYVINAMSIIGIFMGSSDPMARLTVGLTNTMTMTFLLGVLTGMIPKTDKFPYLGMYFLANLTIVIISVLIVLFLPNKHIFRDTTKTSRLRLWLTANATRYNLIHVFMQVLNLMILCFFTTR